MSTQNDDWFNGKGQQIASMVLGIVSLVFMFVWGFGIFFGIPGLILGIMGSNMANEVGAPTGMSKTGVICSIIGMAGSIIFWISCAACVGAAYTDIWW